MTFTVQTTLSTPEGVKTFQRDEDRIIAESWEDAEIILWEQGKHKTHRITGQLICEVPCHEVTYEADWRKERFF